MSPRTPTRSILAVDPGQMTGLSFLGVGEVKPQTSELPWQEFGEYVERVLSQSTGDMHVVCEAFIITIETAKKTAAPWSLEGIGVCRYLAGKYGATFSLQTASNAKAFSSNDRLRDFNWWTPGKGHANDATRHLMVYCISKGWFTDRIVL